jgi:hypothetical protein
MEIENEFKKVTKWLIRLGIFTLAAIVALFFVDPLLIIKSYLLTIFLVMLIKKDDFNEWHNRVFNKIQTKDKEEFLASEMQQFYGKENLERFKVLMKDMDVSCEQCGIYYWKGNKKRCNCKQDENKN